MGQRLLLLRLRLVEVVSSSMRTSAAAQRGDGPIVLKKVRTVALALLMLIASTPVPAHADLITANSDLPSPKVITFDSFADSLGRALWVGDEGLDIGGEVGESVVMRRTSPATGVGARIGPIDHSLGQNGVWVGLRGISTDGGVETTYTFNSGPVSGVGAFMNYSPDEPLTRGVVRIQALDWTGAVLESYDLEDVAPIDTNNCDPARCVDQGAFRGILRTSNDIFTFRVTGGLHVLDNLQFIRSPFPRGAELTLTPASATSEIGTSHLVTASISPPLAEERVSFHLTAGPHASLSGSGLTDSAGKATFAYPGTTPGTDTIVAWVDRDGDGVPDAGEPLASAMTTWQPPSAPGPFVVDTTFDAADAIPGDGTCATTAGNCSLRAAIQEANALPGEDSITVPSGVYMLMLGGEEEDQDTEAVGDLDIVDDLQIYGAGATDTFLDGSHTACLGSVFHVHDGARVLIEDAAIRRGCAENYYGEMGGGLRAGFDTQVTLRRVALLNHRADNCCGALWTGGILTVIDSVLAFNMAGSDVEAAGGAELVFVNSTISGHNGPAVGGADLSLYSSTIPGIGIGIMMFESDSLHLTNSIVAGNGVDCLMHFALVTATGGHNIDSDGSCRLSAPTDQPAVDPMLEPLADNGGRTLTHALLPGSPAVDAVPRGQCTGADGRRLSVDQRGVGRPQGPRCDVGAFELGTDGTYPPPNGHLMLAIEPDPLSTNKEARIVTVIADLVDGSGTPESNVECRASSTEDRAFRAVSQSVVRTDIDGRASLKIRVPGGSSPVRAEVICGDRAAGLIIYGTTGTGLLPAEARRSPPPQQGLTRDALESTVGAAGSAVDAPPASLPFGAGQAVGVLSAAGFSIVVGLLWRARARSRPVRDR